MYDIGDRLRKAALLVVLCMVTGGSVIAQVLLERDTVQCPVSRLALKSNLLELAAGVANIGAEWAFARHYTLHFPVRYSPYTIARNYRLRMLTFQPEVRYWFTEAFSRHFVGVHPIAAYFNVSVNSDTRYQTNRMAYGAGVSYGYAMPLGKTRKWRLEFHVGVGYVNADYDRYYNVSNGALYGDGHKEYWGPTQLAVNLVYLIKGRDGR